MSDVHIFAVETSCDETSLAIIKNGTIVACQTASQQEHIHFGGVVPELASRNHVMLLSTLYKKLSVHSYPIDAIACTQGPGLLGALMVGLNFAKGVCYALGKPLLLVNHLHAHLHICFLEKVPLPALGILVSGGHTALFFIPQEGVFELIATTHDDALGECFDKVAKLLGLPYPGGVHIEKLAEQGCACYSFKAGSIKHKPYDFSFSGLKTAVLYAVQRQVMTPKLQQDIAASFQKAAFEDIYHKSMKAFKELGCASIVCGGGVVQNKAFQKMWAHSTIPLFFPPQALCTDNAAMIGYLGHMQFQKKQFASLQTSHVFPTGSML